MFIMSFRATRKKIAAFCCLLLAVVVVGTIAILGRSNEEASAQTQGNTNEERVDYLSSMGWEVDGDPTLVQDVIIPAEFDKIYEVYNSIQKQQGFDLEEFKGETCKQYIYQITDYPDSDSMVATLIVYDGNIIGGDVSSTVEEGYMHRLKRSESQVQSIDEASEPSDVEEQETNEIDVESLGI